MERIFEIHADRVDSREILDGIEERLAARDYDPRDVERVRKLSFTPVPPAREHGFDPAAVTELFERPVSAPDFNSPKFARFRGPLKWLARVLFGFFSNLHDKLNQNKIQAFYSVVHELIAVNYRHERLLERLEHLQRENRSLRAGHAGEQIDAGDHDQNDVDALPLAPVAAIFEDLNREAAASVVRLNPTAGTNTTICLLDDHGGGLARELLAQGLREVKMNVFDAGEYLQLRRRVQNVRRCAPDTLLAETEDASLGAVLLPDLGRISIDPDALPELVHRKLAADGVFYIRMQRGLRDAPFSPVLRCEADPAALRRLCESLGFRIIEEARPVGLRDGSFELFAQKIG